MQEIRLASDLTSQGYGYAEQAALVRTGQLVRIRRGAYMDPDPAPVEAWQTHRRLVQATVRMSSADVVVSHQSAAVLHGLPSWDDSLSRVHLTRDRAAGGKRRRYVQLHVGPLVPAEITEVDGIRLTTLARTVVDLGRSLSFARAVPIGDAALAAGLTSPELQAALQVAVGRHGVAAARRMAAFIDGRSESVGESTSRVVLWHTRLPMPSLQHDVVDEAGVLVGRADFCWEDRRTLGEFDGKVKYGRLLKPGQSAADVVYAEKLREDRLRDLGWQVVRWTWDDLARPAILVDRLQRAFARGLRP